MDERDQWREALIEIHSRTSEAAFRKRPYLELPSKVGDGILDFGDDPSEICACREHVIPVEGFQPFANKRKQLILQHYSSCWLQETCNRIYEIHQQSLPKCPTAWNETVDNVRDFFGFTMYQTPPVFQSWLGRVLEAEIRVLEDSERPLPADRVIAEWNRIAASLAEIFRKQLELCLKELPRCTQQDGLPKSESNCRVVMISSDYKQVLLQGKPIVATEQQARDIGILHSALLAGDPEVPEKEFTAGRLRDHFKPGGKMSPLWKELILPGSKKGYFRLNPKAHVND